MTILPLADAVARLSAKTPIGSVLKSADWAKVPLMLRERAQFSAGVTSLKVLSGIQSRISSQVQQLRESLGDEKTATYDRSSFIDSIRSLARTEGLAPEPGKAGTLEDITSIPRLGMIYDMQNAQANGYAGWKLDQNEGALALWPADRFGPSTARVPRTTWLERWAEAGASVGWEGALKDDMVALKTSPIWAALSRFGTPWPPFDFGSTRELEDIDREEAQQLGLPLDNLTDANGVSRGEQDFNSRLQASVQDLTPKFQSMLKSFFGDQVEIQNGVASWTGTPSDLPEHLPAEPPASAGQAPASAQAQEPPPEPPLEFANSQQATATMDELFHPRKLGLTPAERAALKDYQYTDYRPLNRALYRGRTLSPDMERLARRLDSALEKASLPKPVIVYRGMKGAHWDGAQVGSVVAQPGYLSPSLSPGIARSFAADHAEDGAAILKIRVPKGAKALYMDNLDGMHGKEAELLIGRGANLRLTSKVRVGNIWHIEAELVP